ncbi:MAG: glyoxalase/bleomycin resistance/dioxygenase family protein [Chloroflexi bacterium]|jgi:catechol 2,3-dioxygenase-like lactoylglutathione lyase family enzyme|nr:glyoxalase/bleomycin resistance/dioxygenase family protein [Chloroflexota bacterium]MBT7081911.1 glyoxalase/bleomycin resistance/dioxygenase family protein [Chloroflexota bacterium]MBT7289818.1 glyoxalase/bleomycin resistance/dioxygenase family protein [Chloroflexota bacterium]
MKFVCPLIVVDDIARSRKFYEEVLRQEVEYDFGENVQFKGAHAIHLKEHYRTLLGGNDHEIAHKANNMELYFETDDVTGDYDRLKAANVDFVHELNEQPWGQRVVRFYDPDGHIVEIGETMQAVVLRFHQEGDSVEEICAKSCMPKEFVEMVIKG